MKASLELICNDKLASQSSIYLQKYRKTQLAFVKKQLRHDYVIKNVYRIDDEAEKQLGSLHAIFWTFFVLFILVVTVLAFLLRKGKNEASQSLDEVLKEKETLVEFQEKVLELRKEKLDQIIEEDDEDEKEDNSIDDIAIKPEPTNISPNQSRKNTQIPRSRSPCKYDSNEPIMDRRGSKHINFGKPQLVEPIEEKE